MGIRSEVGLAITHDLNNEITKLDDANIIDLFEDADNIIVGEDGIFYFHAAGKRTDGATPYCRGIGSEQAPFNPVRAIQLIVKHYPPAIFRCVADKRALADRHRIME